MKNANSLQKGLCLFRWASVVHGWTIHTAQRSANRLRLSFDEEMIIPTASVVHLNVRPVPWPNSPVSDGVHRGEKEWWFKPD